jgi:hypothetical protein
MTMAFSRIALMLVAFAALTALASAGPQQPASGQMDMKAMMAHCQGQHQEMSSALDKALATIRDARESNDPQRLRAALDQTEGSLTTLRQHISMCSTMMSKMAGTMMDGQKGAAPKKDQ